MMTKPVVDTDARLEELRQRALERGLRLVDGISDDQREAHLEAIDAEELRKRHLEHCAALAAEIIPEQFRDDIELAPAVKAWFEEFRHGGFSDPQRHSLCLIGRPGSGKSHTAWQLLRDMLAFGFERFTYRPVSDLFDELADCSRNKRSDGDILDRLTSVDLLVLDDLGSRPLTEFREDKLLQILDRRYAQRHPVIVTTNIAASNFTKHFGARNASRLGGMCRVVALPNFDHRTGTDYSDGQGVLA